MTKVMVAFMALALAACDGDSVIGPDAGVAMHGDCADTFAHPVGSSCGGSCETFCASGHGWCAENTCRGFCAATGFPRCAAGEQEQHSMVGGSDLCVCVPVAVTEARIGPL